MATAFRLRLGTCVFASMLFLIGLSLYFFLPFQPLWTLDVDEEIAGTTHDCYGRPRFFHTVTKSGCAVAGVRKKFPVTRCCRPSP